MKQLTPGNHLTLILLFCCALLGAVLVHEWHSPQKLTPNTITQPATNADNNSESAIVAYAPPGIESFGEILERPLFNPGREPPPEPEPVMAPTVDKTPLRLKLEGVAISTEARVAVIRDLLTNKLLRITEGGEYQGWTVKSVNPAGAIFSRDDQTRELTLVPDSKTSKKQ